jgi:hypothetical protein
MQTNRPQPPPQLVFAATMALSVALGGVGPAVLGTAHASELLQPSLGGGNGGVGSAGGSSLSGAAGHGGAWGHGRCEQRRCHREMD